VVLQAGDLRAVIVNNNAFGDRHRAGYSGIAALYHAAQDSSPFVPEYSGPVISMLPKTKRLTLKDGSGGSDHILRVPSLNPAIAIKYILI